MNICSLCAPHNLPLCFLTAIMASTFQISPASRSDIPELVKVALAAFKNDPIFLLMKQHCAPAEIQASDVQSYDRTFSDPGVRFFKAVDSETG